MYVGERYPLLFIFITSATFGSCVEERPSKISEERRGKHLFPLLGYLHGFKIGQTYALQLPSYVFSPIVIIPSINQQQSVNVQKSSTDENYQESGGTFQKIVPARIVLDPNLKNISANELLNMSDDLIPSQDSLRQYNDMTTSTEETDQNVDKSNITTTSIADTSYEVSTELYDTTTITEDQAIFSNKSVTYGPYPAAYYDNKNVTNLILSNDVSTSLTVPSTENKWKYYSKNFEEESNTGVFSRYDKPTNFTDSGNSYSNAQFSGQGYVYPSAWYNAMVDRLSLTTKSYSSHDSSLPSPYNDGWERYSSSSKTHSTSGFRPLAGLYYDGFLHKFVNKRAFYPNDNNDS